MIFKLDCKFWPTFYFILLTNKVLRSVCTNSIADTSRKLVFIREGEQCLLTFNNFNAIQLFDKVTLLLLIHSDEITSFPISKHLWTAKMGTWQTCRINIVSTSITSELNLNDSSYVYQNPQFTLIVTSELNFTEPKMCSLLDKLQNIHVQSDFIVLTSNKLFHIHLLSACDQNFKSSLQLSNDLEKYKLTKHIYKQFNSHKIHTIFPPQMYHLFNAIPPNCNKLGVHFAGSETYCTIEALSFYLNFSTSDDFDSSFGGIMFHGSRLFHRLEASPLHFVENLMGSRRKHPLGFMLVLRKPPRHFSTLFESLDSLTWIFLFVSSFIIFWCLFLFIKSFGNSEVSGTGGNLVVGLLAGLLEQPITLQIAHSWMKNHWFLRTILSLWLCESIILMGGYRGVFFSLMTKGTEITTPRNFHELQHTHFPIITVENLPVGPNYPPVALIEYVIRSYLNKAKQDTCPESISPKSLHRIGSYQSLLNKSVHLDSLDYSYTKFGYDYRVPFTLREDVPPSKANSPNHTFIIPDDFVLVSSRQVINQFQEILQLTGDHFIRLSKEWDSFIGYATEFVITRNLLLKPVTKLFLQIYEAGLCSVWEKYSEVLKVNFGFKMLVCMEYYHRVNKSFLMHNLKIGLHLHFCKKEASVKEDMEEFSRYYIDELTSDEEVPLTLTILWNIFYSGLLGLLIATTSFIVFELLYHYIETNSKKAESTPVWEYME